MKMKQMLLLLLMTVFCLSSMNLQAAASVATPNATSITTEKKADMPTWKAKIVEKIQQKMAKQFAKPIDLSDPVKKWLWYSLGAWLGGFILIIVGGILIAARAAAAVTAGTLVTGLGIGAILAGLGYLLALAGSVFFIIWLVKKFS